MTRAIKRTRHTKSRSRFPICDETGNEMTFGVILEAPVNNNSMVLVYDPVSGSCDHRKPYRYRLGDLPPGMKIYADRPELVRGPMFITGNPIPERLRGKEFDLDMYDY
jgi:hypothetical protein